MTCPITASSATTQGVGFMARMAGMLGLTWTQSGRARPVSSGAGQSGPAMNTKDSLTPDGGKSTSDLRALLHRRALVQCNRNRDQVAKYLRLHLILAKGR